MKIINYILLLTSIEQILSFKYNFIKKKFKLFDGFNEYSISDKISYSDLINKIENHNVDNIYFKEDMKKIYTKYHTNDIDLYTVTNSNEEFSSKIEDLSEKNHINSVIIESSTKPFTDIFKIIGNSFDFLFVGILIASIIRILFNSSQNGNFPGMPFSQNSMSNNINILRENNISLSSWAGSREVFEECIEVVSYLKNNTLYRDVGAEIPKGILLEGPPGTGKTLIAKAIASEADASFISISASEFVELFVGMGAARVRNLFKEARDNSPCIIFIDEIDAVGRQRGASSNFGNDEREQTLNQLLFEMDGFSSNENVIVIAATNRKDILDKALLRPGRFDRIINVPLPDRNSRKDILTLYMKNKNMEKIELDLLADLTSGFSGAEIKNLINEAAIYAARVGKNIISQKNIEDALEKLIVGIVKKNDNRPEDIRNRIAIHEIGHAFLTAIFKEYFEIKKVTIQSTYNGAGGYTLFNEYPEITENGLYTKDILKKRLIIALGGKAAEFIFYGENNVSLGAIQDLKEANSLSRKMITNYGMGNKLKVFYEESDRSMGFTDKYSENIKEKIDEESLNLVNNAYNEAIKILLENKEKITILVELLNNSTTLSGDLIYAIVNP